MWYARLPCITVNKKWYVDACVLRATSLDGSLSTEHSSIAIVTLPGDNGDSAAMANNSTMAALSSTANSLSLESGVEVDESLMRRSPLVRTLAPIFGFFQSRAGERVPVDLDRL